MYTFVWFSAAVWETPSKKTAVILSHLYVIGVKIVLRDIVEYSVKVFTFIVKYCSFTSSFGARSLSVISYTRKTILLVFQAFEYPKRCSQINFYTLYVE